MSPLNTSQQGSEHDGSSVSSRTSSPDPNQRRDSNSSGATPTPQMNFLQKQKELRERESQVRWWLPLPNSFNILSYFTEPKSRTTTAFTNWILRQTANSTKRSSSTRSPETVERRKGRRSSNSPEDNEWKWWALIRFELRTNVSTISIPPSTEDHYSNTPSNRPYSLQQPQSRAPLVGTNGSNGNGTEEVWLRQSEGRSSGESKS